jgi:hypothetical protein
MNKIILHPTLTQQILNEYNEGLSSIKLSKKYNISSKTIRRIIIETGAKIRNRQESSTKYTFDHNFFESIDTPEKAYFLGFMLADGHVGEREVIIAIKDVDRHIIETFIKCIKGNNRIATIKTKSSKMIKKETIVSRLNLRSDKMIKDLNSIGLTRNKTYNITTPQIDGPLQRHFWRGVFDGDGYVSLLNPKVKKWQYKTLEAGLCGHINTITSFAEFLNKNGVTTSKIFPDHSIFSVRINGSANCLNLYKLLYSDINSDLCLTRKREKFEIHKAYKEQA